MITQFWLNDPTILLNKDYLFELWPLNNMCLESKLNAITRIVILLTILGFLFTFSSKFIIVGGITISVIVFLYIFRKKQFVKDFLPIEEGFTDINNFNNTDSIGVDSTKKGEKIINPETLESFLKSEFSMGNSNNPFSNVLLTQIGDTPDRKSAPPSFNPQIEEEITTNTKDMIQKLNPGIKNTNKQLFDSLIDKYDLDQSNRLFFSTPNTKIQPGDQASFGKWLYGNMPSSKESNTEASMQRVADSYRYTLY